MSTFSTINYISLIRSLAARLRSESDYLCQLDGEVGDGDHGTTMAQGFNAVVTAITKVENRDTGFSQLLELSAKAFLDEVGSTMGPLYTTAFINASLLFGDQKEIPLRDIALLIPAMSSGIADKGGAKVGDKTMMDVWIPVSYTIQDRYNKNLTINEILNDIGSIAHHAADATKSMIALKGRAARLGERSLGHIDPGAASAAMIIEVFSHSVLNILLTNNK
jgi:phosphoenolpyruvate---glycerone phosphotransferase subunit DhaL